MNLTLYQTLENRDNPEEIENEGPFPCDRLDAWLGTGYYFWDSHIELAHWWGIKNPKIEEYIICSALVTKSEKLFDLLEGAFRKQLTEAARMILEDGLATIEDLIVPDIIDYLYEEGVFNDYEAIRAYGVDSLSEEKSPDSVLRFKFSYKTIAYLDMLPPIQLCLFKRKSLSLRNYKVVFPDYYVA